jgi:molybdopterin molybdotransferase
MSWRTARELARGLGRPVASEDVELDRAAGRVLAAEVRSQTLVPGFDASAMDGYAVAGEGPWHLTGRVLAGESAAGVVRPGDAVEVATGAWIPSGTEAVVPYEDCHCDGVLVSAAPPGKPNIRRAGEDLHPGDVLARPGQKVTAALLGLVAHGGADRLIVSRQLRARVVVTGDEVVRGGLPGAGQVRDALGPLAATFVPGAQVVQVPDCHERLAAAVATAPVDVIVVTGSSSVGRADHLHAVLAELGAKLHVDGVACRPGHPQALAELPDGRWVVGLPGNPFAGLVACLTLLEPLCDGLLGRERREPLTLRLDGPVRPSDDLTRLVPVRLSSGRALLVADAGPARLRAAAEAAGVAVVEPGWSRDDLVEILPLS